MWTTLGDPGSSWPHLDLNSNNSLRPIYLKAAFSRSKLGELPTPTKAIFALWKRQDIIKYFSNILFCVLNMLCSKYPLNMGIILLTVTSSTWPVPSSYAAEMTQDIFQCIWRWLNFRSLPQDSLKKFGRRVHTPMYIYSDGVPDLDSQNATHKIRRGVKN